MSAKPLLTIEDLRVKVVDGDKEIIKGLNLTINKGEVHAIMGPNGSGKSTLSYAIAGHPGYEITGGKILLDGEDVIEMEPDERSRKGIFLAFQYPYEVEGISVANFLRTAVNARLEKDMPIMEFAKKLRSKMELLEMDESFAERYLNAGFSGGEKKRNEILQMHMLEPRISILDETDSGLDIDALQVVSKGVNALRGPETSFLIITHYERILRYIEPDVVHVMMDGRIVRSGGKELAQQLEAQGYDWIKKELQGV